MDGCPAGLRVDMDFIRCQLNRRRPGQSALTSQRQETDEPVILSGVMDGVTLGTPVAFLIRNRDVRPEDYEFFSDKFRPGHAGWTWEMKYGRRDHRGGGRASARETAVRVMGGAFAQLFLREKGVEIRAYVSAVGPVSCNTPYRQLDLDAVDESPVRCPDPEAARAMMEYLQQVQQEGDTTGGIITCIVKNCPPGLGEPVFDKLPAGLAKAMLSINAAKGFEIGHGFRAANMKGSEHNDSFLFETGRIRTKENRSGGVLGGISTGEDIWFRVAFKPVSTLLKGEEVIDREGKLHHWPGRGRHDPCVVPRAVPVVEAMAALVIADQYLLNLGARMD